LDAKDLKVFEAVARFESMKRAATELNTVQSNVTAHIRHLEQELGVALFERRPNGMKLTPAGARLLPYAFEVRAALANAKRAVADVGIPTGTLVIGSRKSTSALHLDQLLASYVVAYPDVDIKVRAETSPLLTELVLQRQIEGAFVCNPVEHHELVSELIFDEELVVLTAAHIDGLNCLSPENTKIIALGQGSLYEKQLKAILTRQGFSAKRVIELGTLENIIGCVSAGLGITLLPRAVVSARRRNLVRAHKVPDENCRVQTLFVRRRDAFVSSALSAFLSCARSYSASLNQVDARN
jgi:DNA-binding transcriptional LysR family regulator